MMMNTKLMKKLLALVTALMLISAAAACAGEMECGEGVGETTVVLEANATTGYSWTAFVYGGDSVELADENGVYTPDPAPAGMTGVGGKTTFTLRAVKPGESIVVFTYGRLWETEAAEQKVVLVVVEDDLVIYAMDVTEEGVLDGTVLEVNAEEHTALITTDRLGEAEAVFAEDMAMPAIGEHILLYTNGTMTMSEPPIVNVIAWESVPDGNAREGVSSLPAYRYTGSDPMEAAVAEYTVQLAESIGYYQEEVNVTIPAPVILKVEKTDEDHAKVYGNFWHMNYTLTGDTLLCVSGGEAPGVLELTRDGDRWTVTDAELADDGEDYCDDIARLCNGDQELEDMYFSANDVQTDPLKSVRHRFILEYVTENGLAVTAYQDEYWDPISLE